MHELEQARVFFRVHGHHLEQQTVQSAIQKAFLAFGQAAQGLSTGPLLVDQRAGNRCKVLGGGSPHRRVAVTLRASASS